MTFKKTAVIFMGATLVGCGGGANVADITPTFATSASDTIVSVLNGEELLADAIVTRQDSVNGATTVEAAQTVYAYDQTTEILTMRIGQKSYDFDLSGADRDTNITSDTVIVTQGNAEYGVFVQSDDLQDFLDGTSAYDYLIPIRGYYSEDSTVDMLRSFGIVGLRTPIGNVNARSDIANYTGGFQVENYTRGSADLSDRVTYFGSMDATVDFGTNELTSGTFTVTFESLANDPSISATGTYTLGAAPLNNGAFSSALTPGVTGLTLQPGAAANGRFYGPNAEELGGTISYEGALNGSPVQAFGFFSGGE